MLPLPAGCTGTCQSDRWKQNWDIQFAPALTKFRNFAQSHGKRLSVPEWGVNDAATTGGGGHTFQTELPNAAAVFRNHFASQAPVVSSTRATVSPATVTRGQGFQVGSSISSSTARTLVVKYEIRSASDSALITSRSYTAQAFTAGQTRTYSTAFTLPTSSPAGTYRVDTLVYTADWSQTLLYRNDTTFTAS